LASAGRTIYSVAGRSERHPRDLRHRVAPEIIDAGLRITGWRAAAHSDPHHGEILDVSIWVVSLGLV
jgi:hypothetical protein